MKSMEAWERGAAAEKPVKWFENEPKIEFDKKKGDASRDLIEKYSIDGSRLLSEEVLRHTSKQQHGSRYQNNWMKTVISKGTMADRVAAQILQVQNSPLHSLNTLNSLVGMVRVGKKKECLQVIENLVELWLNDLLRPDQKLTPFEQRPLHALAELDLGLRNKCLMFWWFEAKLKEQYTSLIKSLDLIAKDSIETIKGKAIGSMSQLLIGNPEQEQLLLAQLVNKLGDPQQSVASKAIHYLQNVLQKHPNMQPVVLDEVEKMIFRPNIQSKAQYYAICFIIQFYLSPEDKKLATNMINLYFCLFKVCIKKGELDSRMLRILLSGVKRAFPYAKEAFTGALADHVDTLHKLIHVSSFGVALHALCLLHQVAQASSTIEDRFYSALYKKMLDPEIIKTKHLALFLNIVYKAVKSDSQVSRVQAFIKRLLQIALTAPSNLACSILYLVSQAVGKKKDLIVVDVEGGQNKNAKFLEDDDDDDGEERYVDVKLEEDESTEVTPPPTSSKSSASWSWVGPKSANSSDSSGYTPFNRNPLYTKAESVGLRELVTLANHYHPTVSLFAQNILNKETIRYTGDILVDFSSARFLDRFSFKNPKKETEQGKAFSRTSQYQPKGIRSLRVNCARYLNVAEDQVPQEDLFLYRYMQKKFQTISEKKEEEEESDNESVKSEEFEEMLFNGRQNDIDADEDEEVDDDDMAEDEEVEMDFAPKSIEDTKSKKQKKKPKQLELSDEEDDDFSDNDDEGTSSQFASAEEFAVMLQKAGVEDNDVGGSSAVSNKDNAHVKQLKWEQDRDRWVKGGNKRKHNAQKPKFAKSKKRKFTK